MQVSGANSSASLIRFSCRPTDNIYHFIAEKLKIAKWKLFNCLKNIPIRFFLSFQIQEMTQFRNKLVYDSFASVY